MQVMYNLCSKNTIPIKHKYIHPFPVKLHKNAMLIKTTLSVGFNEVKSLIVSSK